jgi:hypothetical protein
MKKYWKFLYQPGLTYPPNWYGEGRYPIPYEKVTVLLQNDKDGYGIAYCEDTDFGKFSGDIEIITQAQASTLLNRVKDSTDENVFVGAKLATRWTDAQAKQDAEIQEQADALKTQQYDSALDSVLKEALN